MLNKDIFVKLNQVLFIIFMFILWTLIQNQLVANAQSNPQNFRALLEELNQLQQEEPSLIIFFDFLEPLPAMNENTLSVPTLQEEIQTFGQARLGRIGDDYICFTISRGQAISEECVPFSNITSVGYLAGP